MDANQIEKLKALALAATPGPWKWWTSNSHTRLSARGDGDVMYGETLYDGVNNIRVGHADAKFIEASNPAAVLELIAEVERLRAAPVAGTVEKDAERFQLAIALEDNAEFLYAAVLNHAPDATAIHTDFDAAMAHTEGKDAA